MIDSRVSEDGTTIRRRRECAKCEERFNTFEVAELKMPAIVKSDGRRENFDERKLRTSFDRALQKRPVASEQIDDAVRAVVHALRTSGERELPAIRRQRKRRGLVGSGCRDVEPRLGWPCLTQVDEGGHGERYRRCRHR